MHKFLPLKDCSESYLGRPLPWETTCLEGPLVFGRKSYLSACSAYRNLSPKTTCLERPYFITNKVVFQDRFHCTSTCIHVNDVNRDHINTNIGKVSGKIILDQDQPWHIHDIKSKHVINMPAKKLSKATTNTYYLTKLYTVTSILFKDHAKIKTTMAQSWVVLVAGFYCMFYRWGKWLGSSQNVQWNLRIMTTQD